MRTAVRTGAKASSAAMRPFTPVRTGLLRPTQLLHGVPGPTGELTSFRAKPLASQSSLLQAKLAIGHPNDRHEQEADRVADLAMRMPDPRLQRQLEPEEEEEEPLQAKPLIGQITPLAQRQFELDQQEEPEAEIEEPAQATRAPVQVSETKPELTAQIHSLRGGGQPLPHQTRTFFGSRFGHDFSAVRVHTDGRAARAARAVNARAFTVGGDIVFGAGQFAPATRAGQRLLAHELVHAAQQRMGSKGLQREERKSPCAVHAYDNSNPKDTAVIPEDKSGIAVSSVPDMVTKVNAYVNDPKNACSCVARLEINGHGTDGYQSVGNGDQYVNNDKALVYNSKEDHLKQVANIKLCRTAMVMLLGCHVGRGKGKKLLSRMAKILPGRFIGGAQHYTGGGGLGKVKVVGKGDLLDPDGTVDMDKADPFLKSKYVRWHIVIGDKEFTISGEEATSSEGKAKLKKANRIKVKTPKGVVTVK